MLPSQNNQLLTPSNFSELKELAMLLASANTGGTDDPKIVAVKILAGLALGLDPYTACMSIHLIKGKTVMSATLQAQLLKASGKYNYNILELSDTNCKIEFFEVSGQVSFSLGISAFSLDDAKKAKLTSKDVWLSYPRNMLFSRAVVNGIRWFAPDALGCNGAVYDPDELNAPVSPLDNNLLSPVPASLEPKSLTATEHDPIDGLPFSDLPSALAWGKEQLKLTDKEIETLYEGSKNHATPALDFYYAVTDKLKESIMPV